MKVGVCAWFEKPNGKGEMYLPNCLRLQRNSGGVNIYKLMRRKRLSFTSLIAACPYCGCRVRIVPSAEKTSVVHQQVVTSNSGTKSQPQG